MLYAAALGDYTPHIDKTIDCLHDVLLAIQKRLRLPEAHCLTLSEGLDATSAANLTKKE